MNVSIILVNYNTRELTSQCIDSIITHTKGVDYEIILVDNDSHDGSQDFFSTDDRIRFIESGENLGFGKANNLGYKASKGKYLFFLNSDTLLLNNAIKMLYDFMEQNAQNLSIGGLGCMLLDANHENTHSFADFPKIGRFLKDEWGDHLLKRFGKKMKRLDAVTGIDTSQTFFPVDYVTGADIFVAKSVFDQYGGFDPDFFMYYEESEMQYRWKRAGGLQSYIINGPQIVHLEGKSQSGQNTAKYLRQLRSQLLYFKKTCLPIKYYSYRMAFLIGRILTFPFQKMTVSQKKEYLKLILKF